MTEPIQEPERPGYRFPVVAPEIVEFEARLEPFSGAPQGFAGSLEELLDHLRAGSLDLRTLPLAPLIEQYLGFLQRLPQATMNTASEFLPLAATLIHLKSQLLVPSLPQPDQERSVREAVLQHIAQQEQRRREEVAPRPAESDKWDEPQQLSLLDLMVLLRDVQNQSRRTLVLALA